MATTSPADSSFWDDISQLLGKSAAGAGSGRAAEGQYLNSRDTIAARLYDIAQTARTQAASQNLAGDKFRASLPGQGAQEEVRGAIMQNAQPATMDLSKTHITPVSFSGGLSPALFTPETRAAGASLAAHGKSLIDNPGSFQTQTPGSGIDGASFLQTPAMSAQPTAGFWEQAAGAGSIASGLAGALAKAAGGGSGGGGDIGKALAKLFGGSGGSTLNPSSTGYAGTPGGNLGSYDPTNPEGLDPAILQAALALGNIGQDPQSGIDTSQYPTDAGEGVPIDQWNPDDSGY